MFVQKSIWFGFATLYPTVSALALNNIPTQASFASKILLYLNFPAQTPAPSHHELRRRQDAQRTLLVGPDATCGYLGGNATQPWGCTASSTCAFATPSAQVIDLTTTTAPGSVLYCDSLSGCPTTAGPRSCIDKEKYDIITACTGSCLEDENVLKCTSGIYIFCNTITFPSLSISAFFCNYISNYNPVPALTAFSGKGGRDFTPTVQALPSSTSPPRSSSIVSSSIISSSTDADTSTATAAPKSSATSAANGDGGVKNGVNKGAIIGVVVGAAVGLALLAVGGFLVLRRRRAKTGMKEEATKSEAVVRDTQAAKERNSSHASESGNGEVSVTEEKKLAEK